MCPHNMTNQFSQRPDRPILMPSMSAQQAWVLAYDGVSEPEKDDVLSYACIKGTTDK